MQILIEPIPLGYRASALVLADTVTTGKTKEEALAPKNNPYLKIAGVFKNDPTFDDWM
jgi:hypothetical protein